MAEPIDWNRPVVFRDGTHVVKLERETWQDRTGDNRKRVRHGTENARGIINVVLVDEFGSVSRGETQSDWDVVQQGGH